MELTISFDMRAPAFGAPRELLWATAVEQAAWADEMGFDVIGLGEHHCADDGYNPSPLMLAAAMAAVTKRIRLRPSVLLAPFYDPIKLAEDLAVLQIMSDGRLEAGIGGGYRPVEFESFGRRLEDRWRTIGDTIELLRLAWTGEEFDWQGRRCRVTPAPSPPPPILLGGATDASARRAARVADGWFPPLDAALWDPFRDECIKLGKPDPGAYPAQGPIFLWVSEDPDRDWEWLTPHVLHQLRSYSEWTAEALGRPAGPFVKGVTESSIRSGSAYKVLTPEQTLELVSTLGDGGVFYLNPLLAGIAPERSWEMLRLYERSVHPHISHG